MATNSLAPPREADLVALARVLALWRRLARPELSGMEHLPADGRMLLVGNHTLYGFFDVPLLVSELYQRRRLLLRGLSDQGHFRIPLWRSLFSRCGAVEGTRENCIHLMHAGEPILVYPGGAREVHKRRGEQYELLWEGRSGFAELAIQHGYPIVPFAAVGGEEVYDIIIDRDHRLAAPARAVLSRLGARPEVLPPLGRGWAGTPLPRPERLYFGFGDRIDVAAYAGPSGVTALKNRVEESVRAQIRSLLAIRARSNHRAASTEHLA